MQALIYIVEDDMNIQEIEMFALKKDLQMQRASFPG